MFRFLFFHFWSSPSLFIVSTEFLETVTQIENYFLLVDGRPRLATGLVAGFAVGSGSGSGSGFISSQTVIASSIKILHKFDIDLLSSLARLCKASYNSGSIYIVVLGLGVGTEN